MFYVWIAHYSKPIPRPGRKPKVARVVPIGECHSLWARPLERGRFTWRLAVDEGARYRYVA